jgi:regulator of protease activity HflC (stomatin/prohibitin superfamily)
LEVILLFLLFLIIAASFLGYFIIPLEEIGVVLAFGIILGCLVRGLYYLKEIHQELSRK